MMRKCFALCCVLLLAATALAEVAVRTEHLSPVDPAWKLKTIPGRFQTATPINLRGEALGAAQPVQENRLTLDLSAYAPASFVLD